MPKISVIMPVFNTPEEYLRTAIESILNQTYTDFEFLILDDGSTNGAVDVIKSYKDKRIKYFYHDNQGITKTLNWGLELSCGEFIARMDADDVSLPQRFERQIDFLNAHPDISVVGTWIETFPEKRVLQKPSRIKYMDFLQGSFVAHPTVMWRRGDFEKYGLRYNPEFTCAQDYDLWSRAVRYVKFANIDSVLLHYRVHSTQITATKSAIQRANSEKIEQNMLNYLTSDATLQKAIRNCLWPTDAKKSWFYLLGFIPLVKTKCHAQGYKSYLFGFIPLIIKKDK